MLKISNENIKEFYDGTTPNEVYIEFEGYDYPDNELNYFISDGSDRDWKASEKTSSKTDYVQFYKEYLTDELTTRKPYYADFGNKEMYMSMDIYFEKFPSNAHASYPLRRVIVNEDPTPYEALFDIPKATLSAATKDNPIRIQFSMAYCGRISQMLFKVVDTNGNEANYKLWYKNIAITQKSDAPYHISLVSKDGKLPLKKSVVTNEHIEKEQMELTESLCSDDNLIFGSAEASCFNVGLVDTNVVYNNRYFRPYIKKTIDASDIKPEYVNFYVNKAHTNPANIKTLTYNGNANTHSFEYIDSERLRPFLGYAKYLVVCYTLKFKNYVQSNNTKVASNLVFRTIFNDSYRISQSFNDIQPYIQGHNEFRVFVKMRVSDIASKGDVRFADFYFCDNNSQLVDGKETIEVEYSKLLMYLTNIEDSGWDYIQQFNEERCLVYKGASDNEIAEAMNISDKLLLGRYQVANVSKTMSHSLVKKNIQAYDQLYDLEKNVADWYTFYMFGVSTDQYQTKGGYEFARQIYSTYFNLAKYLGLEDIDYKNEEEIWRREASEGQFSAISDFTRKFYNGSSSVCYLHYYSITITNQSTNPDYLYRVRLEADDYMSDRSIVQFALGSRYSDESYNNDPYGRGFTTKASICIVENDANGNVINKYLVDSNDYFKISMECATFTVYVPYGWNQSATSSSGMHPYMNRVFIYRLYKPFELANASTRLVYYKYFDTSNNKEIFACDSNLIARDVLRSILEPTGSFYHIDRYGKPCFKYCTKSALYPSNKLYPDDTLYPRKGVDGMTIPTGKYLSFVADDYEIKDIGRIQILKNDFSNKSESVCQWEYLGDSKKENTYIISDNIFYCHENMEYEYDNMPEVSQMLDNMYTVVSNLGYTPSITVARAMPWMEVGDRIGLITEDGGIQSFIYRRTMTGIQKPRDTYESRGDEKTEAINNYAYKSY